MPILPLVPYRCPTDKFVLGKDGRGRERGVQMVRDLIEKGIRARMRRELRSVEDICQKIERSSRSKTLSKWEQAHLDILKIFNCHFEIDLNERHKILIHAGSLLTPFERGESFLFLYESAGFHMYLKKYPEALRFAQAAEKKSFDANSLLSARLNVFGCYEAMGIDFSDKIDEAETILNSLDPDQQNPKISLEFNILVLRSWFRNGEIEKIANYKGPLASYLVWLNSLPQLSTPFPAKRFELDDHHPEEAFVKYQTETILFRFDDEDLEKPPITRWCDRLYLWMWTALKNPDKLPFGKVLKHIEHFDFELWIHRMTLEDRLMVCNCFTLLSFFDPNSQESLKLLFERLSPLEYEKHPLLEYERLHIEILRERIFNKKTSKQPGIHNHELAKNTAISYFSANSENWEKVFQQWPGLRQFQGSTSSRPKKEVKVLVDVRLGQTKDALGEWTIKSHDVAKAFQFLLSERHRDGIHIDSLMQVVFGLPYFDQSIHYRKIYNLLARMKKISQEAFDFGIRQDVINFQIKDHYFHIIDAVNVDSFDVKRWRQIVARIRNHLQISSTERKSDRLDITSIFSMRLESTRADLQNAFGWNKTKANRMLKKLLQKGVIKKNGQGPRVTYSLVL